MDIWRFFSGHTDQHSLSLSIKDINSLSQSDARCDENKVVECEKICARTVEYKRRSGSRQSQQSSTDRRLSI